MACYKFVNLLMPAVSGPLAIGTWDNLLAKKLERVWLQYSGNARTHSHFLPLILTACECSRSALKLSSAKTLATISTPVVEQV